MSEREGEIKGKCDCMEEIKKAEEILEKTGKECMRKCERKKKENIEGIVSE